MVKILKPRISSTAMAAVLSVYTLVAFHLPLFKHVVANIEGGINGVIIVGGFALLMLALNFMIYTLLLGFGHMVGRCIVALSLVLDAMTFYFIVTYDVLITDAMMGNVFNTRFSEASGFFSLGAVLYTLLLGVAPATYTLLRKVEYPAPKRTAASAATALGISLVAVLANFNNFTWIDRHATQIGSLLMPWSYTVNTVRYFNGERQRNRTQILLPDATIADQERAVCVLVIGESARRDHFSLYGYGRPTNPRLEQRNVTPLVATASATYTTAGVKAILDHKPTNRLYEILPNYLQRNGVEVAWRSNNWGEPPLHVGSYMDAADIKQLYPDADPRYDGILLEGLRQQIEACPSPKLFVVLHTSTSHGPTYYKKYPAAFEHFTPVCTTVEMAEANHDELMNAYDNTILYTDYLLDAVIEMLEGLTDRRSCLLFISDHGESLGENNLYMHGVPMALAPREQIEIPFIVWSSTPSRAVLPPEGAGHYNIFHSVLDFLNIESPIYDPTKTIFAPED